MDAYISLDVETIYGVWDVIDEKYFESNVNYSFKNLRRIIDLHEKYDLKLNLGVVGLLFKNQIKDENFFYLYRENKKNIFTKLKKSNDSLLLICDKTLGHLKSNNVQLLSHTFYHNYLDSDKKKSLIDEELKKINLQVRQGLIKKGIIFPKNQASDYAINSFLKKGYTLRLNFNNPLYKNKYNSLIRLFRFIDSFLPLTELLNFLFENKRNNKKIIEGGIFFRPSFMLPLLDKFHLFRIIIHYYYCKFFHKTFHLWSHPHNFGNNVNSLNNYEFILNFLTEKRVKLKYFVENE